MAITIPHSFVNGNIAEAAEVNANFTAVKNYVDGLSTGANIDNSAIVTASIANYAVTTAKIADGAITESKFAPNVLSGENDQIVLGVQIFG